MIEFNADLVVALIVGYFAGKLTYLWGYRDGMRRAVDDLHDAALKLKELGERAYAEANRQV